jgi:hypothetical protein
MLELVLLLVLLLLLLLLPLAVLGVFLTSFSNLMRSPPNPASLYYYISADRPGLALLSTGFSLLVTGYWILDPGWPWMKHPPIQ